MTYQPQLNDRVRISCERDTKNPDIRRLRDERAVGVVKTLPASPTVAQLYYVGFNGDDLHSMYSFLATELVPESDDAKCDEQIPVMRWHMDGLPDLLLKDTKNLDRMLEETFLGETGEWKDFIGGKPLTCTFEMMSRSDFEKLEPWEA